MALQIYVKPMEGRGGRHETTGKRLPPEGDWWPNSPYTRRLLHARDIVEATAPDASQTAPQPETANTTAVAPAPAARRRKPRST